MITRAAALVHRKIERSNVEDVQRLDQLVAANHRGMAALLARVEHELGPADRVVVLQAEREGAPDLFVHRRAHVLAELRAGGRVLEAEELGEPAPADRFHVLAGTADVLEVRTLPRSE